MKRVAAVCLLLTGCSSAPIADLMDHFAPGRLPPAPGYHGGVGVPQQPAPPPEASQPLAPPNDGTLPPLPPTNLGVR